MPVYSLIRPMATVLTMCTLLVLGAHSSQAQDNLKFSGTVFSDYSYQVASPVDGEAGENGFGFRRVYLTTDYKISDSFSGRFRLEGADNQTTSQGKPSPFIKDLYLRWNDAFGDGHRITFGMTSPPMWGPAESQWGYRALEKTIQDRIGIASSRDIGIAVNGPLTEVMSYTVMVGNNSGGKRETDKYKRVYGQLEFRPSDRLRATVGANYYQFDGGSSASANAFVGYSLDHTRFGIEAVMNPTTFDDVDGTDNHFGFSLFANHDLTDTHRLVLRYDREDRDNLGAETASDWAILGLAFLVDSDIQIIPNVIYEKNDADDDASILARLTVWANF